LVAGGRADAAGTYFEEATRLAPADDTAHYYLGMFHLEGGKRLDLAESAFREATRLAPDYVDAQLMLGLTKEQLGQDDEAITWYRQASQTAARRGRMAGKPIETPLLYLSRLLISRHRYPEVVPVLQEALAWNASSAEVRRLLGQSLFKLNQFDASLPHLEEAARLNPQDRSVHYLLMGVFRRLGRAEDARREGEIFRQLDGQTAEVRNAPP
jgi:tetratricopeptide (TPR) repeat protein